MKKSVLTVLSILVLAGYMLPAHASGSDCPGLRAFCINNNETTGEYTFLGKTCVQAREHSFLQNQCEIDITPDSILSNLCKPKHPTTNLIVYTKNLAWFGGWIATSSDVGVYPTNTNFTGINQYSGSIGSCNLP